MTKWLPPQPTPYLGLALLMSVFSISIGGIIGAINAIPPTDGQISAITGLISFLAGSLVGRNIEKEKKDA
jgi:hypothetical protein